jgi:predicted nucleic-acid-binding Zn-ribbon protein
MKQTNQCPKCHSNDIVIDAMAIDHGHYNVIQELSVATYSKPEAVFFKGTKYTTLSAWVCADCGYVEFYADLPRSIKLPT